jgi:hypothetical protein
LVEVLNSFLLLLFHLKIQDEFDPVEMWTKPVKIPWATLLIPPATLPASLSIKLPIPRFCLGAAEGTENALTFACIFL